MKRAKKISVLVDSLGSVIGAGPAKDDMMDGSIGVVILPLPDQAVHEVALPTELQDIEDSRKFQAALWTYSVDKTSGKLIKR